MSTIYYRSATYAREHGELDQYRETSKALKTCQQDIETAISTWFDGMHLSAMSVTEVLSIHSPELVGLLLSATVIYKEWDGRFSRSNKEWARTVRQLDREGGSFFPIVVNTHPAILDGFINLYRKATA